MAISTFPGTLVKIPLNHLLPNARQPRRRFKPGSIQEIAESLKTLGQKTPLKVRPLTEEEKKANPGFEYLVIGGHRRRAGAEMAGLPTLDCMVLNIPPEDTHLESLMDNNQEEMDWWDWDLAIEEESKATGISQRKLAERLGVSDTKVFRALKVVGGLTPAARNLVTANLDGEGASPRSTPNKGFLITESILLALADLGDPLEVEKALRRVIDDQMTESQVKALVAAMNAGTPLEAYTPAPAKPKIPKATGAPSTQAKPNPAKAPGAGAKVEATPDVSSQIGALMAAHTLGKGIPGAHLVTGRLLPHITNLFHGTKGRLMNMGVKNHLMGTIFTLLIFLFVGGSLISFTSRLLRGIYLFTLFSPKAAPSEKASMPSPNPGSSPNSVQPPTEPRVEGQGSVVPNRSANGNGGIQQGATQPPTAPNSSLLTSNSAKPVNSSPKEPTAHLSKAGQQRVQAGTSLAEDFAKVFYGLSYKTFSDWGVRIGTPVYTHYYGQLLLTFFPELKLEGMQKRKLDESFDPTDPPKVVGVDGKSETILVKGTATVQSDLKYQGQLVGKGPVALLIHVNHTYPDHPEGWVDQVKELTALDFDWTTGTVTGKPQGDSFGKQVGDGVKDADNAVGTAQLGEENINKAKGLLGF